MVACSRCGYGFALWKGVLPLDVPAWLFHGADNGDGFQPEVEADVSVSQDWLPHCMDAGADESVVAAEH